MNDVDGYCLDDLEIGMSAYYSRTVTDADVFNFAGVLGNTWRIMISCQVRER